MEEKDSRLDFVLRYYQEGKLNTQEAIRRIAPRRERRSVRRWVAVAASLAALAVIAATLTIGPLSGSKAPSAENSQPAATLQQPPRPASFHFDDTPLPEVLQTMGDFYGVRLEADDSTKRLTADFDTLSLEHNLQMIEETLGVKIGQ